MTLANEYNAKYTTINYHISSDGSKTPHLGRLDTTTQLMFDQSITTTSNYENEFSTQNNIEKVIFILIPTGGNFSIDSEWNKTLKSNDKCINKLQEFMKISERRAEILLNTNMSLYAFKKKIEDYDELNLLTKLTQSRNLSTTFLGFVRPMIGCAIPPSINDENLIGVSTRRINTSKSTTIGDRNKIQFTIPDARGPTSPWGDLAVKTTKLQVDIYNKSATTSKKRKPTHKMHSTTAKSKKSTTYFYCTKNK